LSVEVGDWDAASSPQSVNKVVEDHIFLKILKGAENREIDSSCILRDGKRLSYSNCSSPDVDDTRCASKD
jgi:hypothetical protein